MKNVFIDMGTHKLEGLTQLIDTLKMDSSWIIHSFEPNPDIDNTDNLNNLNRPDLQITLHKKACWVNDGNVELLQFGSDGMDEGATVNETECNKVFLGNPAFFGKNQVACIDIYSFIKGFDDSYNIYMKMDVEYSEYKILETMIERQWPDNIKEIWIEWHYSSPWCFAKKEELTKKLEKLGVKLHEWH